MKLSMKMIPSSWNWLSLTSSKSPNLWLVLYSLRWTNSKKHNDREIFGRQNFLTSEKAASNISIRNTYNHLRSSEKYSKESIMLNYRNSHWISNRQPNSVSNSVTIEALPTARKNSINQFPSCHLVNRVQRTSIN